MEFKATQLSIDDTFRLKRKYIIPRFQREYSWETDELTTIWEDLLDNMSFKDGCVIPQEYFLGSLVLVGDDDDTSNTERYIVDGQQRLMTFTIAFSALTQIFFREGDPKLARATFSNILAEDSDGNEYTKLVAQTPKPFFQYRIQQFEPDTSRSPQSEEEKRILNAFLFFEKRLEKSAFIKEIHNRFPTSTEAVYFNALKAFRDQILACKVIYVTVKNFEDAYTIFEVLNAKGKDLTAVDIIKNSIFSILTSEAPLDFASEQWREIRNNVANCNEELSTFYRHYWLSKYSFTTAKKLVKDFQKQIPCDITSYTSFLKNMEEESHVYSLVVMPVQSDWVGIENIPVFSALEALRIFGTSQVRTFLLALFDVKRRNIISHRNFLKALTFLEYFHFVFTAICSSRASGLERRYSSYARKLRNCKSKEETADCVTELIDSMRHTIPPYEVFEPNFLSLQYTSEKTQKKALVQYVLKKCEIYYSQTGELAPLSFTIEHIIPESSKADYIGMIGNLLPLGDRLNGPIGNKDFSIKMSSYPNSQYATTKKFVEKYAGFNQFSKEDVIQRTKDISRLMYTDVWSK